MSPLGTVTHLAVVLFAAATSPRPSNRAASSSLINQAHQYIRERKVDDAFASLAEAYSLDPSAGGLQGAFESCLRLKIDLAEDEEKADERGSAPGRGADRGQSIGLLQDRLGLASLLIDRERYEEAAVHLRLIVSSLTEWFDSLKTSSTIDAKDSDTKHSILDKASSMLYRAHAAACQWEGIGKESNALVSSLRRGPSEDTLADCTSEAGSFRLPPLHPFEALKWPCISLEDATFVAKQYSLRAQMSVGKAHDDIVTPETRRDDVLATPRIVNRKDTEHQLRSLQKRRLKIGYISPDFTRKHPLTFLMQDVFRLHDRDRFEVSLYSLSRDDGSKVVQAVKNGADHWTVLTPGSMSADDMASVIADDSLDIMVDLCGHAGTMTVSEVMARRVAPVQVSYMGFPGSSGSDYLDYLVCDETVVPPSVPHIRRHYTERLIIMPHCYFVNSHKTAGREAIVDCDTRLRERRKHGLRGFVFCCHSRPDKIDPTTFRTWMRALSTIRQESKKRGKSLGEEAVLWLLRSGKEMEDNLRTIARDAYGLPEAALVFVDIAPREDHLRRIALADVFLDTPAYNAHTLGCDTLFAGVPMISLLRPDGRGGEGDQEEGEVGTDKLASRVGASLLKASGLEDLIVPNMSSYEEMMIRSLSDECWFGSIRNRLTTSRDTCPLFDTERWVRNLEAGLTEAVLHAKDISGRDIVVVDKE